MEELYAFIERINDIFADKNLYFFIHPTLSKHSGFGNLKSLNCTLYWKSLWKSGTWDGKEDFLIKGTDDKKIEYLAINALLKFFIENDIQQFTVK